MDIISLVSDTQIQHSIFVNFIVLNLNRKMKTNENDDIAGVLYMHIIKL